jgi:hypothetical protein
VAKKSEAADSRIRRKEKNNLCIFGQKIHAAAASLEKIKPNK